MPLFPSSEWMDAFCEQLTVHPRAAQAATHLCGVHRFLVEPGGPLAERHTYAILLAVVDGTAHAEPVVAADDPRVTVSTDYRHWRQLLEGRLDLGPAVLFGRLRVSGDVAALLSSRAHVDVVIDALRRVDTTWLDQTA
jgi:hypothetical protein